MLKSKDKMFLFYVQKAIRDFEKGKIKREKFFEIVKSSAFYFGDSKKSYPQVIHNLS